MRITGVEPARGLLTRNLNLARLPIPPYPHIRHKSFSQNLFLPTVDSISFLFQDSKENLFLHLRFIYFFKGASPKIIKHISFFIQYTATLLFINAYPLWFFPFFLLIQTWNRNLDCYIRIIIHTINPKTKDFIEFIPIAIKISDLFDIVF